MHLPSSPTPESWARASCSERWPGGRQKPGQNKASSTREVHPKHPVHTSAIAVQQALGGLRILEQSIQVAQIAEKRWRACRSESRPFVIQVWGAFERPIFLPSPFDRSSFQLP